MTEMVKVSFCAYCLAHIVNEIYRNAAEEDRICPNCNAELNDADSVLEGEFTKENAMTFEQGGLLG